MPLNKETKPSTMDRMWHKVNFKWSKAGLNTEFSFSETSCLTKAKDLGLFYYIPLA